MLRKRLKVAGITSLLAVFMGAADYVWAEEYKVLTGKDRLPRSYSDSCAKNADMAAMKKKVPGIYSDFQAMGKLSLSGKSLYKNLKDPANDLTSCMKPARDDMMGGQYMAGNSTLFVYGNADSINTMHEYFHAGQDISGAYSDMFRLNMRDATVALLLSEAAAAAYELVFEKEAETQNVKLYKAPNKVIKEKTERGTKTTIITSKGVWDDPDIRKAFDRAYNEEWKIGTGLIAADRQARALEAGGKAATRWLLEGRNTRWSSAYAHVTFDNINNNRFAFRDDNRERKKGYKKLRYGVYSKFGRVSANIDLTPNELLGTSAGHYIDKYMKANGLVVSKKDVSTSSKTRPAYPGF